MDKLISAEQLMQQVQRKKPTCAKIRYTEGFNDAIMKVRSMIHSAPDVRAQFICKNCKDAEVLFKKIKDGLDYAICIIDEMETEYNQEAILDKLNPKRIYYSPACLHCDRDGVICKEEGKCMKEYSING